jgi:GAF domain-containing protein/HAMP domain-containing protein
MRWSVGQKLVLSFLLMTILMAVVGAFSIYYLNLLNTNTTAILRERQPILTDMAAIESGALLHSLKMEQYVTTGNKDSLDTAEEARKEVETRLANLETSAQGTEDQQLVSEVRQAYDTYIALSDEMKTFYASAPGKSTALESRLIRISAVLGNNLLVKADALYKAEQSKVQELTEANVTLYPTALRVTVASTLILTLLALALSVFISRSISAPIGQLVESTRRIAGGDLTARAQVKSTDEFSALANAFNIMAAEMQGVITTLEQRVAERTKALEHQSVYLQASAEVGRAASSILEVDRLITQVVELIRERFDLYYVGLFSLDEAGEWAILRAGTGEAGRAMLGRGHRLQVGGGSMIGWSVANAQARVALEAGADAVRLATAELPDTRSEAALPLRSRGRVLGALTVQSTQPGAFYQDAVAALQIMADQVAVALDNANLFAQSQAALEAVNRASAQLSRQAWTDLLKGRADLGYRSTKYGVTDAGDIWRPEMEQAFQETRTVQAGGSAAGPTLPLAVPIKVRGQTIGVVDTHKSSEAGDWMPEEVALLESLAEQLGVALESARLYQDTQQRATRERMIGEIASRMRESLDMETVLRTTADEIYQALGLEEVTIRLVSDDGNPSTPA